jgi:hypothetical protein
VLTELQPGLGYMLSRHLSAAKLASCPQLGLAIEVLMAAGADGYMHGVPTEAPAWNELAAVLSSGLAEFNHKIRLHRPRFL